MILVDGNNIDTLPVRRFLIPLEDLPPNGELVIVLLSALFWRLFLERFELRFDRLCSLEEWCET